MIRSAFLKRMATAALACALLDLRPRGAAKWAAPMEYPILHGDGVGDDTEAIRALIRHEPVWDVAQHTVRAEPVLRHGLHRLTETIHVPAESDFRSRDCSFVGRLRESYFKFDGHSPSTSEGAFFLGLSTRPPDPAKEMLSVRHGPVRRRVERA